MKKPFHFTGNCVLLVTLFLAFCGCSKSAKEIAPSGNPLAPKEAASQLQQAFKIADVEVRRTADASSEALKAGNYEEAVQSIQSIKAHKNLTVDQGTAVYNAEVALEAKLISGVSSGDPKAARAYELLRESRRN